MDLFQEMPRRVGESRRDERFRRDEREPSRRLMLAGTVAMAGDIGVVLERWPWQPFEAACAGAKERDLRMRRDARNAAPVRAQGCRDLPQAKRRAQSAPESLAHNGARRFKGAELGRKEPLRVGPAKELESPREPAMGSGLGDCGC